MAKITSEQQDEVSQENVSLEVRFVQLRSFENFKIQIDATTSVNTLKCQLELLSGIPAELIQLFYNGERLISCLTSVLQTSGLAKENTTIVARMSQDWEYFIKTCIKSENYQAVRRRSRVKMQVLTQEDRIFVTSFVAARHSNSALLFGILPCNQSIGRTTELSRRNILHAAIQGGDQSCIVNILMNGGGTLIDQKDIDGETPLSMAINMPGIVDMLKAYTMMIKQNSVDDRQYDQMFDYSDDGDFESSDSEKETEDYKQHTSLTSEDDVNTVYESISKQNGYKANIDFLSKHDDVTAYTETRSDVVQSGNNFTNDFNDASRKNNVKVSDYASILIDANDGHESGGDSGFERTYDGNHTFGTSTNKSQTDSICATRLTTPATTRRNKHSANYQRRRKMGMPSLLMSAKSPTQAIGPTFSSLTSELSIYSSAQSLQPSSLPEAFASLPNHHVPSSSPAQSLQPSSLPEAFVSPPNHHVSSGSSEQPLQQPSSVPQSSVSPKQPSPLRITSSSHLAIQHPSLSQSNSSTSNVSSSIVSSQSTPQQTSSATSSSSPQTTTASSCPQSSSIESSPTIPLSSSLLYSSQSSSLQQYSAKPLPYPSSLLNSTSFSKVTQSSSVTQSLLHNEAATAHSDHTTRPKTGDKAKLNDTGKAGREKLLPKPPKYPLPGNRRVTHMKYLNVEDDRSSPFRQRSSSSPHTVDRRLLNRARTRTRVLSESSATEKDADTQQLSSSQDKRLKDERNKTSTQSSRNRSLTSTEGNKSSFLERLSSEKQGQLSPHKHKQRGTTLESLGQVKHDKGDSKSIVKSKEKTPIQNIAKREQKNTVCSVAKEKQQRLPAPGNTTEEEHERIKTLDIPNEKARRFSLGIFAKRDQKRSSALSIPQVKERRYSLGGPLQAPLITEGAASMSGSSEGQKRKCSSVGSSEAFKTWLHKKDEEALERDIQLLSQVISRSSERKIIGNRDEILAQLKLRCNKSSEKHSK